MRGRIRTVVAILAMVIVGPAGCGGGESPTEPTPDCAFSLSASSVVFGSDGGAGTVSVATSASCAWAASSGAAWIAITEGAGGTGPGTVRYAVSQNSLTDTRHGSLTIAGQTLTVSQDGRSLPACTYGLSPASASFGHDAASGEFSVASPAECRWTATSNAEWLTIRSAGQGSGSGVVSYGVARNSEVTSRTALIAVADRTFTVSQSGDVGACHYVVDPVTVTPCMASGSATAIVTTSIACPWTASVSVPWLTIEAGAAGSGPGIVRFRYSSNYELPRAGLVLVRWPAATAGQNIRVDQAGCHYAVTRSGFTFAASGGTGTFDVLQQSEPIACGGATQNGCLWSATSDVAWVTVTSPTPQLGDNRVAFIVAANAGSAVRTGTIAVGDQTVRITQAGSSGLGRRQP